MQREIIVETFVEGRKRAEVGQRFGISVNTYDNHLQAASRSLRHLPTQDAEAFTDVDRSLWFDRIEELRERCSATRLRSVSGKKGEGSNSEGERSIPEGEGSSSARERGKTCGAGGA
jgi:hypothetical protein